MKKHRQNEFMNALTGGVVLVATGLAMLLASGCSSMRHHDVSGQAVDARAPASEQAAAAMDASFVTDIAFRKNSADLTDEAREILRSMVLDAKSRGDLDEIKILAWADQEYPADHKKSLSEPSRKLADRRAANVESYLKSLVRVRDVDSYNMAARPNSVAKLLDTSDARVKNAMEATGIPTTDTKASLTGKASHAVVMVMLKK